MIIAHKSGLRFGAICLIALICVGCSREARKAKHLAKAETYFAAHELEKAKIEYLNVLRVDYRNATAIARLGSIWFEQGAPLRAYPYLFMAREVAPENVEARGQLIQVLTSLEEMASARQEAFDVLDRDPANEDALMFLAGDADTPEESEDLKERLRRLPEGQDLVYHLAWARLSLTNGDTEYARSELERALQAQPKSVQVHLGWAAVDLAQGKIAEAENEYKTAADLSGSGPQTRFDYARFEKENGTPEKAKSLLQEISHDFPDFLPAWRLLAQIAFEAGAPDEAAKFLDRIFERDFANFEARMLQVDIWLAQGETKPALEWLERLDGAYQNVPLIKYELARAYIRNNDPSQAILALDAAITIEPDYAAAIILQGELNLRAGDAPRVLGAMTKLLKSHPGSRPAQLLLVEALRAIGHFEDAAVVVRNQIREAPESGDNYLRLGVILREEKQPAEARKMFERALELMPGNLSVLDQLVDLDIAENNFDAALGRVGEQLKATPLSAGAYLLQGKVYFSEKKWDQAEAALLKAVEIDSNLPGAYGLLVASYVAANKVPLAIEQLQDVLAKNPNDVRALMSLSLIYDKTRDYTKARDTYEKLLSVQEDPGMMNNLAYIYAEHFNQLDKAYEWARRARIMAPANPAIADTLGWIFYKQGRYQNALGLLQESVTALPDSPEIQFHFGMACYMMDRVDPARVALKKAVASQVDFPSRQEAARWLAYLEDDAAARVQFSPEELEKLVQQRPNDPMARVRLGEAYERQGALEKAAAAYETVINGNPRLVEPTLRLARLYAGPLHKLDAALGLAKTARDLAPDDPRTAGVLGKIAFLGGNFDWAYGLLVESVHGRNNDVVAVHDLGWAAYSLGKLPEAERMMQRVLELAPDSPEAGDAKRFLSLTKIERSGTDPAAAEVEADQALKADPNYVPALMIRAGLARTRGKSSAAIDTYLEILRRFPDFAPAQKRLAASYLEDPAALDKAYDLALKARKVMPDDPDLAVTLAEISYQKKDYAYAVQLLRESAKRKPLGGKDLYYLGMSQLKTSQDLESRKTLEQALAAGLQEPLSAQARETVSELRKREGL